ncbi:MAG: hypothetical protein Q9227_000136 [Pyrenula ochraceoflavens]
MPTSTLTSDSSTSSTSTSTTSTSTTSTSTTSTDTSITPSSTTSSTTTETASSTTPTTTSDSATSTQTSTTSTTSTTTPAAPTPTNDLVNPGFEIADSAGSHVSPWTLGGLGSVQSNTNNAYQSHTGSYFTVLYGRSSQTSSITQTFPSLVPGGVYSLEFFYRYFLSSTFPQTCQFTVSFNGVTVVSSVNPRVGQTAYVESSVGGLVAVGGGGDVLGFVNTCPRLTGAVAQANLGLDDITLTRTA